MLLGTAADPQAGAPSGEDLPLSFLQPADRPGVLGLLGSHEVLEVIGQGGMGIVLKAFDPILQRLVAIKVPTLVLAGSAHARRRFIREAQAAAAVWHENVVAVHGVHETEGLPYLVMQLIEGESLQARLDRTGPLPIEEVVHIGLQTARGLAAAHAQGLIHRDIKPGNLLLEGEAGGSGVLARSASEGERKPSLALRANTPDPPGSPCVKITDFGLARLVDDVGLTQNGVLAGTPEYMAPEQARGEPVDHRADLFSLGSVLYALCTGVPPFRAATPLAVLRQVSDVDVRLIDVQIRSGPASPPSILPKRKRWLLAVVALGFILVLLCALGVLLQVRRRDRTFASPGVPGTGEEGEEKPGPADPEAVALVIAFSCPGCGKNLRARAALAGKSLKCPRCGQGVRAPGTQAGGPLPTSRSPPGSEANGPIATS